MSADVSLLFDEWAARVARGERPDPREYLDRAGSGREDLSRLMDAYLQAAPRRKPDTETVELARAWLAGASPLTELRVRRGIRVDTVVDAIVGEFALGVDKAPVVKRYYHRLEAGLLDPAGVSNPLLDLLARTLGVARETILAWRARPLDIQAAFREPPAKVAAMSGRAAPTPISKADEDDDEVRALFRTGG